MMATATTATAWLAEQAAIDFALPRAAPAKDPISLQDGLLRYKFQQLQEACSSSQWQLTPDTHGTLVVGAYYPWGGDGLPIVPNFGTQRALRLTHPVCEHHHYTHAVCASPGCVEWRCTDDLHFQQLELLPNGGSGAEMAQRQLLPSQPNDGTACKDLAEAEKKIHEGGQDDYSDIWEAWFRLKWAAAVESGDYSGVFAARRKRPYVVLLGNHIPCNVPYADHRGVKHVLSLAPGQVPAVHATGVDAYPFLKKSM